MVFGKEWFKQHRKILLWLLNTPLIKVWFRWVMRIRKCDLPLKTKIIDFGPNWFTHSAKLKGDKVELQTSFRSNEKYARRLLFAFEPIWWMFHALDWLTSPIPQLNLGFDTLPTVYSTPGSTVSGNCSRNSVDEALATIRASAGVSNSYDTGSSNLEIRLRASTTLNQYQYLARGFFLYDTSALGASAIISVATVGLYFDAKVTTLGTNDIHIVSSTPNSNTVLANGDYSQVGSTSFGNWANAVFGGAGYMTKNLDANGISNVSKTGISKFAIRCSSDLNNNTTGISWSNSSVMNYSFTSGGYAGTTRDPKLDITYTVPATGHTNLLLMGVA